MRLFHDLFYGTRPKEEQNMAIEQVKAYLKGYGLADRIREFEESSATVELAAHAVGVEPARIAKSLSFKKEDHALIIVVAGDARIDNRKYKDTFGMKAKMLTAEEVEAYTGHQIGGVCPFANPESAEVYLDDSMKRFETVYPAAGSANSAAKLSLEELMQCSRAKGWVDVCKDLA